MNISLKSKACSARAKAFLLAALCACCLPLLCRAQQNKLIVTPPEALTIKRGAAADGTLRVQVLAGFHVNSDKPKDEFLIPLKLTWTSGSLQVKSITYPAPEQVKVGADLLNVFTGTFNIQTQFTSPASAPPGNATMTGKLRYQACNSDMCFRPATIDIKLPVSIE